MKPIVRGELVAVGDMQALDLGLCVGHPRVQIKTDEGRIVTICGLTRYEVTSLAYLLTREVTLVAMESPT